MDIRKIIWTMSFGYRNMDFFLDTPDFVCVEYFDLPWSAAKSSSSTSFAVAVVALEDFELKTVININFLNEDHACVRILMNVARAEPANSTTKSAIWFQGFKIFNGFIFSGLHNWFPASMWLVFGSLCCMLFTVNYSWV